MKRISRNDLERPLTVDQLSQLEGLAKLRDDEIDMSDAPSLPDEMWKGAVRGKFYRPVKQAVSMRLDADVIAWLKKDGDGYQTRANKLLRERMLLEMESAKAA